MIALYVGSLSKYLQTIHKSRMKLARLLGIGLDVSTVMVLDIAKTHPTQNPTSPIQDWVWGPIFSSIDEFWILLQMENLHRI